VHRVHRTVIMIPRGAHGGHTHATTLRTEILPPGCSDRLLRPRYCRTSGSSWGHSHAPSRSTCGRVERGALRTALGSRATARGEPAATERMQGNRMTVWTSQSRTTLMPRTTCRCASALRYGCSGPDRHRAGGKRWRCSGTTCRSASAWATHGEALSSELLAAMVAISAAAHALDALCGQLVTAQIKANGPRGTSGERRTSAGVRSWVR
jgi:hypothetical protein